MNHNADASQNTSTTQSRTAARGVLRVSAGSAVAAFALAAMLAPAGPAAAAPDSPLLPANPFPDIGPPAPPLTVPDGPVFTIPDFPDLPDSPPITVPDGPVFTIPEAVEIPELDLPDDLLEPTQCTDWNPDLFTSTVNELEGSDIEIRFTYDDDGVCAYTVGWSLRDADDVSDVRASGFVALPEIAAWTTDAGGDYSFGIDNDGLCDWQVWIGVEEGLPVVFPGTSEDCDPSDAPVGTAPEDTTPEDTTPEDTTPEDTTPEDTTPEDTTPEDTTPEDTTPEDTTPEDTTPVTPSTPVDNGPAPHTPESTPSSRLPQTGSNSTQIMLAGGLIALGLGSAAALATRRRQDDQPEVVA